MKELKLIAKEGIEPDFVENHSDFEQYALFYSKKMSALYPDNQSKSEIENKVSLDCIDRYIRIKSIETGRIVYRRCQAKAMKGLQQENVIIGSRTWKELGLIAGNSYVLISVASFVQFYLFNSDKYVRITTWIGLIGFILTFISSVITIVSLFVELPFVWCK